MRSRVNFFWLALGILLMVGGCDRAPGTPTPTISGLVIITPTSAPSSTVTSVGGYPSPEATQASASTPGAYPEPQQTSVATTPAPQVTPTQVDTTTSSGYPAPQVTPTQVNTTTSSGYPAPVHTPTTDTAISSTTPTTSAYPGPSVSTATSIATLTPVNNLTPTPVVTVSGTPMAIPGEIPPVPAVTPPSPGSQVRIWVAWEQDQVRALNKVIDSFQDVYPSIRFNVVNIPHTDLQRRYEVAVYEGGGPSLLIAPAEWGPAYYESQLVSDLSPYASVEFLAQISPAALGTGQYAGALISLPVAQEGVVLLRNSKLIPSAAETFTELSAAARTATRRGNLGAYFDRGAFYSGGHMAGLSGALMDADQYPAFNGPAGLVWLDLLAAFDVAGAVGMNTNRDLDLFKTGRIGYIIEGTWSVESIEQALGEGTLVIDPWPEFGTGRLSGFVQAEAIFLNPNVKPGDAYAALLFMGYLLTPDVQQYLAEFGMIPVTEGANPRPIHIAQAMVALDRGTAYPPVSNPRVLTAYWEGLQMAIQAVFTRLVEPQEALDNAVDLVLKRLSEMNP